MPTIRNQDPRRYQLRRSAKIIARSADSEIVRVSDFGVNHPHCGLNLSWGPFERPCTLNNIKRAAVVLDGNGGDRSGIAAAPGAIGYRIRNER